MYKKSKHKEKPIFFAKKRENIIENQKKEEEEERRGLLHVCKHWALQWRGIIRMDWPDERGRGPVSGYV